MTILTICIPIHTHTYIHICSIIEYAAPDMSCMMDGHDSDDGMNDASNNDDDDDDDDFVFI